MSSSTPTPDVMGARWTPVFRVEGRSMEPTFRAGRIAFTRPRPERIRRGEIVLVHRPDAGRVVKRVVGVAGDLVELEAGALFVNGLAVDGRPRIEGPLVSRWSVPAGHYFVVGDNGELSLDSRVWIEPFVAHTDIAGVVLTRSGRRGLPDRAAGPRARAFPARRHAPSSTGLG